MKNLKTQMSNALLIGLLFGSVSTLANTELDKAAKILAGNIINLGNDKINTERFPWLCTTRDPWNTQYEAQSTTQSAAQNEVISKCGIFSQCSDNVICVDRKNGQTTKSETPQTHNEQSGDSIAPPAVYAPPTQVVYQTCTDNSNQAMAEKISKLQLENQSLLDSFDKVNLSYNSLKDSFDKINAAFTTINMSYTQLKELYVLPKQTSTDKLILSCSSHFNFESEVSRCVSNSQKQNASTGEVNFCASYTENEADFNSCMIKLKVEKISMARFEVCKKVSRFWSDRSKCLTY